MPCASPCTCCGTGTGVVGPLPGDPSNDVLLTATWFFGGIQVAWSYPGTNPNAVAHTRLYRSITNNFGTASLHRSVNADHYFDQTTVSVATTYYYWIEIVAVSGTVGDVIGPASAIAIPRLQDYLELLTDQISEGVLATALRSEVLRIQEIADDLDLEAVNRVDADDALMLLVSQTQTDQGDLLALIVAESAARTSADGALATSVSGALVSFGDDLAAVEVSLQANIDIVDGEVTNIGARYTALVTVNGLVGGFGIYNDGTSVQAGFDVDTFWIGRTALDKVLPFIVTGGVVYMQNIVVQNALIESLSAEKILAGNIEVLLGLDNNAGIYGGKTAFNDDADAGFWLGLDGAVPKFIFGNAGNTKSISWDGTTLLLKGDLIATGNIKANAISATYLTRNATDVTTAGGYAYTECVRVEDVVISDVDGSGTTEVPVLITWAALTHADNSDAPHVKWKVTRVRISVGGTASGDLFEAEISSGWKSSSWGYPLVDEVLPGTYDYVLWCATSSSRDVYDSTISATRMNK